MIDRLDRYFFRKAATTMVGISALILIIVIGMDIVLRLKVLLGGKLGPGQSRGTMICLYYLYQIPALLSPILPITVIVSAIIATAPSLKRGEFTALSAAGISLRRSCRALLCFAVLAGLVDLVLSDQVAPRIEGRRAALEDALTGISRTARQWPVEETGADWFARRVILVPGESPVLEDVVIAPRSGGLVRAAGLERTATGAWILTGPVIRSVCMPDGRFTKQQADTLPCVGELALPYDAQRLSQVLMSHTAMTSPELLRRASATKDSQVYLATCLNRFIRLVLPLLALLMVLPIFIRFDNRDALIMASIRALIAGLLPLGIIAVGGNEAYNSSWGATGTIATTLLLAGLPGTVLFSRWHM